MENPEELSRKALEFHRSGNLAEAEKLYRQMLSTDPENADASYLLAMVLQKTGRLDEAERFAERASILRPDNPAAVFSYANILRDCGKLDRSVEVYKRALDIRGNFTEAIWNMANVMLRQGKLENAINLYKRALSADPGNAVLCRAAMAALAGPGYMKEMKSFADTFIQANAACAAVALQCGSLFYDKGDLLNAASYFRKAIDADNTNPDAWTMLGTVLKLSGKLSDACACYGKAIELNSINPATYNNLGTVLAEMGDTAQAITIYRKAITLSPGYDQAFSNLLMCMHYRPEYGPEKLFNEHLRFGDLHQPDISKTAYQHNRIRSQRVKLRIGYVSPDFRTHSVAYFAKPLILNRDTSRFEIICYSDVRMPDTLTDTFRSAVDTWHDIRDMNDDQAEDLIRKDEVDILVDLAGHTWNNRLSLFARKCAPVQVTYLGYPDTTGLTQMDYRFTDSTADPEGSERFCTEKLIRIDPCFLCYVPPDAVPVQEELPFDRNGYITFGSFNVLPKVNEEVIRCWAQLLQNVKNSRLILKCRSFMDPFVTKRMKQIFEKTGIVDKRFELVPYIDDLAGHFGMYSQIDVALDTFPYNGTTTTCEALWMGVPVITCSGQTHASRTGASILSCAGLGQLVAGSVQEYIEKTIHLTNDITTLRKLRRGLRGLLRSSVLCNADIFAGKVEKIFNEIVRQLPELP